MSRRRGLRARSAIDPGARVGASDLGAAWLSRLLIPPGRGRSALDRGRELAESGSVGVLTWELGRVSARVEGDRNAIHPVVLRVERLGLPAWRGIVEAMARAPRLLAAVLDGELPEDVVIAAGGVDQLVPASTEVRLTCGCSSWALICEHAAAVWYLAAHAVDDRPATLVGLRGHDGDLVAAVRRRAMRNRIRAVRTPHDPGVDIVAAFVRVPAPLPAQPPLPVRPGTMESLTARPPAGLAIRQEDVQALADDAARRAWELATGAGDGDLGLDADADLARRVSRVADDQAALIAVADATGIDAWSLARLGLAWRAGGTAAVEVLLRAWSPPPAWLTPGTSALGRLGPVICRRNRVTAEAGGLQLRLGRDRRWYLLGNEGDTWVLRDPPRTDPAEVLRDAGLESPPAPVEPQHADSGAVAGQRSVAGRGRPSRPGATTGRDTTQLTLPW